MTDTQGAMREEFEKAVPQYEKVEGARTCYFTDDEYEAAWEGYQAAAAQSAEKISAEQRYAAMWEQEVAVVKRECAENIARLEAEKAAESETSAKHFKNWVAAELSNKQLHDAGNKLNAASEEYEGDDGIYIGILLDDWHEFTEALAQQPSTEALAEYVAKLAKWQPIETLPKKGEYLLGVWEGNWDNPRAYGLKIYHASQTPNGPSWSMKGNYRTEEGGAYELAGWLPIPPAPKE